jgi:pyrimidine-nucleoside phosphorylase
METHEVSPGGPASVVDWIVRKRDGGELDPEQIQQLIARFMQGEVTDYQLSAWLMAVFFQGLTLAETVALTQAMLHSGRQLTHPGNSRPKVDKHSTGGVGDKISLCLAPLVAACGAAVPMISGRGLGHTGGTLDKLEAIPGYQVRISAARFQSIVRRAGVSIIGQTKELAPADARIYALRDVTGTVASRPLIVASILSKKLAAGLDALVMDVKVGDGAFMRDRDSARALSQLLSRVGGQLGLPVRGLLTEMTSPIGHAIGNALEVREAIEVLQGAGPPVTRELTLALGTEMLRAAGLERQPAAARRRLERALSSGAGAECFARMIALHGGDARVVAEPWRLPRAPSRAAVLAPRAGYVSQIDARALGLLGVWLGAGRTRADQAVDPRVGIELCVQVGAHVEANEPLAHLHLATRRQSAAAAARALAAFTLSARRPSPLPCVLERWGPARG